MILVLGTGRSGTSQVAQILEELGVNMGSLFHLPDKFNKEGYFEDREFQDLNLTFFSMDLKGKKEGELWDMWRDKLDGLILKKNHKYKEWGLKDPGIADNYKLLNEYMKLNPQIIWCVRNKEDTIKSLMRFKDKGIKEMTEIYERRWRNIKSALKGKDYLKIECNQDRFNKTKLIEQWITN